MGHISPLLGIILELKDEFNFIYFGLEGSMEEEVCKKYNIEFHKMKLKPFYRKNIFKNIITFYLILKERKIIRKKYKNYDIKAIVSSGGFVSIPLILSFKNRKKILLESNTTIGLANKLLANYVSYIGIQFPTIKHKKCILTGNPIKVFEAKFDHPFFYLNEPIILFVGGSNGAFEIVKAAYEFNNLYPNIKLFVITGKHYYDTFTFNNNVRKFKRIEELSSILHKFRLVISRAGGATITELLLANVVFILIPSGNVVGNHQVLNANYIKSMGACEVIDDIKDLKYLSNIYDLIFNQERRNNILLKQKDIAVTDSITRIKKLINKL